MKTKLNKLGFIIIILSLLVFSMESYCAVLSTKTYDASINFKLADNATTSIALYNYPVAGKNISSNLLLHSTGKTLGADERCTLGKMYLEIKPGNERWAVIMYAKTAEGASWLLDPSGSYLLPWKYRNGHIFGDDTNPVGTDIPIIDWRDPNTANPQTKYKYFIYSAIGYEELRDFPDDLSYATIAKYNDREREFISKRIQITIGGDMSIEGGNPPSNSEYPVTFSAPIEIELYTN